MTLLGIAQIVVFFADRACAVTKPVGMFMYRVFEGQRTFLASGSPSGRASDLLAWRREGRCGADMGAIRRHR